MNSRLEHQARLWPRRTAAVVDVVSVNTSIASCALGLKSKALASGQRGVSEGGGAVFSSRYDKDHSILGSILGPLSFGNSPRGSGYLIIKELRLKDHDSYGFWGLSP